MTTNNSPGLSDMLAARGLDKAELAQRVGKSFSAVCYWVREYNDAPPVDRIRSVSEALELTTAEEGALVRRALARLGLKAA